jgi:hypothetical protein
VYSDDLAHIHHLGFTKLARGFAPELLSLLLRHGIRATPRRTTTLVEVGAAAACLQLDSSRRVTTWWASINRPR